MIYRQKAMPRAAFEKLAASYRNAYCALKEPSGAAIFVRQSVPELLVVLSQHYSEVFERLSPDGWESLYDIDLSAYRFVAGDRNLRELMMDEVCDEPDQRGSNPSGRKDRRTSGI